MIAYNSNIARVIPNRADSEGPHERTMIVQAILCDPRVWARSLACARDDKPKICAFHDPKSESKNPARGTRFSNATLNGDS